MKRYPNFILSLLFLLLTLLMGCKTSDDDRHVNDTGTAPTISDVVFYKCDDSEKSNPQMSISFNDGDYYYRRINYKDPDLDIRYVHVTIYIWEDERYIVYDGPDVSELTSQESESDWDEDINAKQIQLPSGSYRYQFQVEDKENNTSNTFRVNMLVN
jgi:hypothetical protein